ncbi:ribosome silencing factor [Martelella sp. AD-3]|uniref:ribosome silencing factor n=1 Tax=Martelella sp. AD-3 TaxID=686597 RepID=UPI0005669DFA|nr:ribosome silencing factor [Martelella sp. AD-3]AMM85645.1 ribosome-associated protein IOJAP [Martelella sp. AD-3]MAM13207.1 ribosome silencing factor [Rhizobiaceae bacterium]|tara:strand:- start:39 stop:470 length:432 start_codon:yes stop_codon:yes gene_type:complete
MKKGRPLTTLHAKGAADDAAPKSRKSGVHAADQALSTVLASLEDSKAEDIVTIDIKGKSALGDHMVVVSGRSNRHVVAICDHLVKDIKQSGAGTPRVEGQDAGDWVLIDTGDVIVHVFRPEVREFYNIEKMWSAPEMNEGRLH